MLSKLYIATLFAIISIQARAQINLTTTPQGDSTAGAQIAKSVCLACHGIDGRSNNPLWPNIRGQKFDYLTKQIHDFKSGERKHILMNPISQTLSDQDILNVSKYYSELQD